MSAYICDQDTFKKLAAFAVSCPHPGYGPRIGFYFLNYHGGPDLTGKEKWEVAEYWANVLYQENIRSVRARYSDEKPSELPGPIDRPDHICMDGGYCLNGHGPIELLKTCDCLEYQSCETNDYYQTAAFWLLQAIRKAAIHALPGYDESPGW